MTLRDDTELENTREKLRELEQWYEEALADRSGNPSVTRATLRSYKRLINQLKEEIARYEAHQPTR